MFTPSHLAISQINDISNLKAWNILEQSMERSSHTFTSLGWVPNGEKKGLEPVLEEEQRSFVWYGLGSFWLFHGFQSPTVFPRGPRGEK